MNKPLASLIRRADAMLDAGARSELAALIEAFVANRSDGTLFSPEELAHLREVDAEPFDTASDAEVKSVFDRARA